MRTHATPGLRGLAPLPPAEKTLEQLEDDYQEYRHACNNRLCVSEPAVHEAFLLKIRLATERRGT